MNPQGMSPEDLPRGRSSNTPPNFGPLTAPSVRPGTADQRQRAYNSPPLQVGGVIGYDGPATLPAAPVLLEVAATVVRRAREIENLIQRLEMVVLGTCGGDGSTAACQPGPDSIAELLRLADVSYGVCAQWLHMILARLEIPLGMSVAGTPPEVAR